MEDDAAESKNALWRREKQLRLWDTSETNSASAKPRDRQTSAVKFHDGCVFLAACSSGDTKEVDWLLGRGADINTANVDGLTALHQACIDDNLPMVKFLVDRGADIDACDNEGWTALHATASCGFVDIARYLLEKGARLDAVNNDAELPIDLAEGKQMVALLSTSMQKQGIDAETARKEEEQMMLCDANQWLNGGCLNEQPHAKTGATALHVAAAKGYIKVIKILLEAGADVNAKDYDGWTPLHAAAHWGQDEACKLLAERFASLTAVDHAGRTPLDVADTDVERLLEELKKQQDMMRQDLENRNRNSDTIREISPGKIQSRRSSVTRLSVDQRQIIAQKNAEDERLRLQSILSRRDDTSTDSPLTTVEGGDVEQERLEIHSPPAVMEIAEVEEPLDEETAEQEDDKPKPPNGQSLPTLPVVNGLPSGAVKAAAKQDAENFSKTVSNPRTEPSERSVSDDELARVKPPTMISTRTPTSSIPAANIKLSAIGRQAATVGSKTLPEPVVAVQPATPLANRIEEVPAMWRASLRKTGSADVVCPPSERDVDKLTRSSSVSWGPPSKTESNLDSFIPKRLGSANESENKSRSESLPTTTAISAVHQTTLVNDRVVDPYARYKAQLASYGRSTGSANGVSRLAVCTPSVMATSSMTPTRTSWSANAPTTITTRQLPSIQWIRRQKQEAESSNVVPGKQLIGAVTTASSVTTIPAVSSMSRRASEVPKRDEEKEIERKARAKRARESRRSTQGVSKEDLEKAGASLQAASSGSGCGEEISTSPPPATPNTSTSSQKAASLSTTDADDPLSSYRKSRDSGNFGDIGTGISTGFMMSLRNASIAAALAGGNNTSAPGTTSSSKPVTAAATAVTASAKTALASTTTTTPSITSPKTTSESTLPGNSSEDTDDSLIMTAAARARRRRESRRPPVQGVSLDSTAVIERRSDEENRLDSEKAKSEGSSQPTESSLVARANRLPVTCLAVTGCSYSLVPTSSTPSVPSDSTDFKALYEQERQAREQLSTEVSGLKKELVEVQQELERLRNTGASVNQPTSSFDERRALQRKVSELEEEVKTVETLRQDNQRLRDENGALIRVISKLSK